MQKIEWIKKLTKILKFNRTFLGKSYDIILGMFLDHFLGKFFNNVRRAKNNQNMIKFIFYVPKSHLEKVKSAISAAGAGQFGNYKDCFWQVLGQAQFTPLEKSQPYIGHYNHTMVVDEYRVETICPEYLIDKVIEALRKSHPYEEPVYDAWQLTHHSSI